MLKGECPKCGACYLGWALAYPEQQICDICSTPLEIIDENGNPFTTSVLMSIKDIIISIFKEDPTRISPPHVYDVTQKNKVGDVVGVLEIIQE